MKLITTIYLGIGFILVMICGVTFGYLAQTKLVKKDIEEVMYSSEVMKEAESAQKLLIDMETGLRGYLLTGKEEFLEPYRQGSTQFQKSISRLDTLTRPFPIQNKIVHTIQVEARKWEKEFAEPLAQHRSTADENETHQTRYEQLFNESALQGTGKKMMDQVRRKFKMLTMEEDLVRNARIDELNTSLLNTSIIAILLTCLAILAGVLTARALGKNLGRRFHEMTSLADKIAGGTYDVSIKDSRHDEISSLIASLNVMASKLQVSFSHLTKMNQELDQFAYVVSHDLKAPLRAINNLAEWIAEDMREDDLEIKQNLIIMRGRVQRMENLINGILDYSKIGRKEVMLSEFSVDELLREIVDNLSPAASFQINIPSNLPVVQTERTLLYQVFSNLLSNALRYHHLPEGIIQIRYKALAELHQFEVEDDGPGIPEEYRQKVFKMFQTMEARDVKESTGVGLAIVKKIVDEKGGQIWIEDAFPHGAKFIFTWPKAVVTERQTLLNKEV